MRIRSTRFPRYPKPIFVKAIHKGSVSKGKKPNGIPNATEVARFMIDILMRNDLIICGSEVSRAEPMVNAIYGEHIDSARNQIDVRTPAHFGLARNSFRVDFTISWIENAWRIVELCEKRNEASEHPLPPMGRIVTGEGNRKFIKVFPFGQGEIPIQFNLQAAKGHTLARSTIPVLQKNLTLEEEDIQALLDEAGGTSRRFTVLFLGSPRKGFFKRRTLPIFRIGINPPEWMEKKPFLQLEIDARN